MTDHFRSSLKAYAALVGAVCTALLGVLGDSDLTEVLTIVAAVATAVATYAVPNKDPKGKRQDESVQPPKRHNTPQGVNWVDYAPDDE